MQRRQVVEGGGQQVERDRNAIGGDDQMQPPAKELLLLRRAVAAILRPAYLLAPSRPRPPTDRQRHGVDDEDLPGGEGRRQAVEGVEAAIEARDGERA